MTKEAVIRVRLDTRQAKRDLKGLTDVGKRAAGGGVGLGAGMRALGLGAVGGAAAGAVTGSALGGIADIFHATLSPIATKLEQLVTGDAADEARAAGRAQSEVEREHGFALGAALASKDPERIAAAKNAYRAAFRTKYNRFAAEEAGAVEIRKEGLAEDVIANLPKSERRQAIEREVSGAVFTIQGAIMDFLETLTGADLSGRGRRQGNR